MYLSLCLTLSSSSVAPNAGFLDFHELQALQYNVVIDARPIREETETKEEVEQPQDEQEADAEAKEVSNSVHFKE